MLLSLPRRPRGRGRGAAIAAGAALIVVAMTACAGGAGTTAANTAPVERATISVGATAAGSLAAGGTENLGFPTGGQLTSVGVQVGDLVSAGDVLAKVDDFGLRKLLVQQQANLAQQRAVLGRLTHSPLASGAKSSLSQARQILGATKGQVGAAGRADGVAIDRANAGLSAAEDALSAAKTALAACSSACETLQASVASAKSAVVSGQTAVASAEQKQKVDGASGQVSIEAAQQGVVTAQNNSESLSSDRPYNIEQQQAAVTSAQALVDLARHNLTAATLRAPFEGTIIAINGVVGEYLTASTGTTAQAPGSDAAIPGTAINVAASTITRPGGTQFMVISSNAAMTAVVPFQEADAARILPGQSADLAFDALPELQLKGTVTAVSPAGTALSGAMSFFVTIRLDSTDKLLKEGLSVRATVHTQERKEVLSVPNNAIHTQDGTAVVLVVNTDGSQHSTVIQTGLVGADRTEVVSGLTEGQQVVVPTATH